MKLIVNLSIQLVILTILTTCNQNPIAPDDSSAVPGRRDYIWVVDTIGNPYLDFYNIWGNSLDNIWTAGVLMCDALYRYDGLKWNLDNRVYISDPIALWGYGNDLWIGNDKGCIWKFTGENYKQELNDFTLNGKFIRFIKMTGTSNNEIYAVGDNRVNPILMKYDGSSWDLDKTLPDTAIFNQIEYCYRNDRYYLVCALNDYTTKIYEYDRKNLKVIYEYPPSNAGLSIASIDGYLYIAVDKKVYRYYNNKMEFIFEINSPSFGGVIWGRNRKDIFIRMQDGLAHYNGTDWQYLFKSSEPISLSPNCVVFEKEFFIPARIKTTGYNVIYHGKLK